MSLPDVVGVSRYHTVRPTAPQGPETGSAGSTVARRVSPDMDAGRVSSVIAAENASFDGAASGNSTWRTASEKLSPAPTASGVRPFTFTASGATRNEVAMLAPSSPWPLEPQLHSRLSVVIASAWRAPALTAFALPVSCARTGRGLHGVLDAPQMLAAGVPTWPTSVRPQPQTLPSLASARLNSSPAVMLLMPVSVPLPVA